MLSAIAIAVAVWIAATAPAQAKPAFGFNDSFAVPPEAAEAQLNRLEADVGAQVNRIVVSWADVDRDPTQQNWSVYDRRIASIRAAGMRPLIVLQGSPAWARPNLYCFSSAVVCPPDVAHLRHWERFSYQVAARYPDAVAIEVWNEPNWLGAWANYGGANPEHYAQLFRRSAGAIHYAQPSMPVLVGSLTYSPKDVFGGNMSIPTFLRRFASAGGLDPLRSIDGIGIHPYPWIDEMETLNGQFATIMRQIRAERDRWMPGLKIWVTETGATTTGPHPVTERQQARTIIHLLNSLQDDSDLGAVLVHTSVEPTPNPRHPAEEGSGVLKWADFRAKPAYCALRARVGREYASYPGCPADISQAIGMNPAPPTDGSSGGETGGGGTGGGDSGGGSGGDGSGSGDGGGSTAGPGGMSEACTAEIARLRTRISRLRARKATHRPYARQGYADSKRIVRRVSRKLRNTRRNLRQTRRACEARS